MLELLEVGHEMKMPLLQREMETRKWGKPGENAGAGPLVLDQALARLDQTRGVKMLDQTLSPAFAVNRCWVLAAHTTGKLPGSRIGGMNCQYIASKERGKVCGWSNLLTRYVGHVERGEDL